MPNPPPSERCRRRAAVKLLEDTWTVRRQHNVRPRIPHVDPQMGSATPPCAGANTRRARVYWTALCEKVLQDPPQHQRIGEKHGRLAAPGHRQLQPLRTRDRHDVDEHRARNRSGSVSMGWNDGFSGPDTELRKIENSAQQLFDGRECVVQTLGRSSVDAPSNVVNFRKRRQRKPRCMQRLQEIVTDGREEARLETVGPLRSVARRASAVRSCARGRLSAAFNSSVRARTWVSRPMAVWNIE